MIPMIIQRFLRKLKLLEERRWRNEIAHLLQMVREESPEKKKNKPGKGKKKEYCKPQLKEKPRTK